MKIVSRATWPLEFALAFQARDLGDEKKLIWAAGTATATLPRFHRRHHLSFGVKNESDLLARTAPLDCRLTPLAFLGF